MERNPGPGARRVLCCAETSVDTAACRTSDIVQATSHPRHRYGSATADVFCTWLTANVAHSAPWLQLQQRGMSPAPAYCERVHTVQHSSTSLPRRLHISTGASELGRGLWTTAHIAKHVAEGSRRFYNQGEGPSLGRRRKGRKERRFDKPI